MTAASFAAWILASVVADGNPIDAPENAGGAGAILITNTTRCATSGTSTDDRRHPHIKSNGEAVTTLEERARHIAEVANECCNRSDGYEESVYKTALILLKETADEVAASVQMSERIRHSGISKMLADRLANPPALSYPRTK